MSAGTTSAPSVGSSEEPLRRGAGEPKPGGAPDLATVLDEVRSEVSAYVAWPSPEDAIAFALYIAATHAQPAFEHATRLLITSPTKGCGKTRALEVARELVHRPLVAGSVSAAALVRLLDEDDPPTVVLDEADTVFRRHDRSEAAEALRAVLNLGFSRGWPYARYDAQARRVVEHPTFAFAILASIRDLPDTIMDRGIPIRMRKRAPGERVRPWRARDAVPRLRALRGRLHAAVRASLEKIGGADPPLPVEDRAADRWAPLFAIAEVAGDPWPERVWRACVALEGARREDEVDDIGVLLLAHIRDTFEERGVDRLSTAEVLRSLVDREDGPWPRWWARDVGRDEAPRAAASRLARMLHEFRTPEGKPIKPRRFADA